MEQQKWDDYKELDIKYLYSKKDQSSEDFKKFQEAKKKVFIENKDALTRLADK